MLRSVWIGRIHKRRLKNRVEREKKDKTLEREGSCKRPFRGMEVESQKTLDSLD